MNIKVCCPSYRRPHVETLDYLPFVRVYVDHKEYEDYNGNVGAAQFLRDSAGENPFLALQEKQFDFEVEQKTGQGADIEDISGAVMDIWGYEAWEGVLADGIPVNLTQAIEYQFGERIRSALEVGTTPFDDAFCEACERRVDGVCPLPDEHTCPYTDEEVMLWYWGREAERMANGE